MLLPLRPVFCAVTVLRMPLSLRGRTPNDDGRRGIRPTISYGVGQDLVTGNRESALACPANRSAGTALPAPDRAVRASHHRRRGTGARERSGPRVDSARPLTAFALADLLRASDGAPAGNVAGLPQ